MSMISNFVQALLRSLSTALTQK